MWDSDDWQQSAQLVPAAAPHIMGHKHGDKHNNTAPINITATAPYIKTYSSYIIDI